MASKVCVLMRISTLNVRCSVVTTFLEVTEIIEYIDWFVLNCWQYIYVLLRCTV